MKTTTFILVGISALLLADLGLRIRTWHSDASFRAEFAFRHFYTNGAKVFGIEEAKTGRPLLVMFDTADGEKPGEMSYFLGGTNILDVYLKKGEPPLYRFIFHGPGKSQEWWMNLGGGPSFTARVSYDTNGDRSDYEAWYEGEWRHVDRRDGQNGVVIDGRWHQLSPNTY